MKTALIALNQQKVPEFVRGELHRAGIELAVRECSTRADLEIARDAQVVWSFGDCVALTADNMDVFEHCRAIVRSGSGTDQVPVAKATARGIAVMNTPGAVADAVSDHAIALLFAVVRQIPARDREVRGGVWERHLPALRWHLRGQTLGLVGFGRIGQLVAEKLGGFHLRILVYDPYADSKALDALGARAVSLDELVSTADFVSIHCALTAETHHLIGARELARMHAHTILINTARGGIVDERALFQALTENRIGGAGLDVVDPEPPHMDNPLLQLENVIVTPHIGGYSDNSMELAWSESVQILLDLQAGKLPGSVVNRADLTHWSFA